MVGVHAQLASICPQKTRRIGWTLGPPTRTCSSARAHHSTQPPPIARRSAGQWCVESISSSHAEQLSTHPSGGKSLHTYILSLRSPRHSGRGHRRAASRPVRAANDATCHGAGWTGASRAGAHRSNQLQRCMFVHTSRGRRFRGATTDCRRVGGVGRGERRRWGCTVAVAVPLPSHGGHRRTVGGLGRPPAASISVCCIGVLNIYGARGEASDQAGRVAGLVSPALAATG